MLIPRVLAVVLAGGSGSRMGALTDTRTKPSIRMGGTYRLIDIALSNLANSHIDDVWIVEEYLPHTLNSHLSSGRPWDLDRTHGGIHILAPFTGAEGEGFANGNSDSLWRHKDRIAAFEPELVLVLSADHLYTIDFLDVIATHRDSAADLTLVTTRVKEDASRHGVVDVDDDGRVRQFWYKPEDPPTNLVATEIFCFDGPGLVEALELLHDRDDSLSDYGDDLIPFFVSERRTAEHRLDGYWRDLGTLTSYWQAHQELIDGSGVVLDHPRWPIRSAQTTLLPARIDDGAAVADSLIAPGALVSGTVKRCVISPRAIVEAGAELTECVVLDGARIRAGARLARCIVDEDADVGHTVHVGGEDVVTLLAPDGRATDTAPLP